MQTRPRLRGILFDLDGVLVDSRGPITSCINVALEKEGLSPSPPEELYVCIGPPLLGSFARLLEAQGADPSRASACVEHYRARYDVIATTSTPAFPGIDRCVGSLAAQFPLAVATSKPAVYAQAILESLDLAVHFQAIVGPSLDASHKESKADTVGRALRTLGLGPGAPVAMVGDRHFDIHAGQAHGLWTLGVEWGIGDAAELEGAGADELVADPDALCARLVDGPRIGSV